MRENGLERQFKISGVCHETLSQFNCDAIETYLEVLYNNFLLHDEALYLCRHFQFYSPGDLRAIANQGLRAEREVFWGQVNLLLTFVLKSSVRSGFSVVEGILSSIESRNELSLSLTARAFIEHACTIGVLADHVSEMRFRLLEIWPIYDADSNEDKLIPTEADRLLHGMLFRYALNRKIDPKRGAPPDPGASKSQWEKYYDIIKLEDDSDVASESVMKSIGKATAKRGYRWVNVAYSIFSEYCHPNSAARTLDYYEERDSSGVHIVSELSRESYSPAFVRLLMLTTDCIPALSVLMTRALSVLSECRMPMEALDEPSTCDVPPIGSMSKMDSHGRTVHFYFNHTEAKLEIVTALTPRQVKQVEDIRSAFSEFVDWTLDQWIESFACELPARVVLEIKLWEHAARVLTDELARRQPLTVEDRKLLFLVAVHSRQYMEPRQLLSAFPALKRLPGLEDLFQRFKEFTIG